jgi:hypothetical protein
MPLIAVPTRSPTPTLRECFVATAAALVLSLVYCNGVFATWSTWGALDWDQHLLYHAVPVESVLGYGQFPLWNPYSCGGMALLANPQSRVLSPFFPLHLTFGFLTGVRLEIWLHVVVGLLGGYALGRRVLASRVGAATLASVFMLNGMYAHSVKAGMTWSLSIAYVPWCLFAYVQRPSTPLSIWMGGGALALVFFSGGAYVLTVTLFGLGCYSVIEAIQQRRIEPLARLLGTSATMTGLGAIKLLPALAFLREFPRPIDDYSGYSLSGLFESLFSRETAKSGFVEATGHGLLHGFSYGADENLMYIGVLAGALLLLGIASAHPGRVPWLALLMISLWLSLGHRVPISLWDVIHELPVYDSMRVAQRFRVVMMLCAAFFCGLGMDAVVSSVWKRFGRSRAQSTGAVLVALLVADLLSANSNALAGAFTVPPATPPAPGAFQQTAGDPTAMLGTFLQNLGTVDCYETAAVARSAIPREAAHYRGEAFLDGAAGSVQIVEWSPNRVRIDVRADEPGLAVLNQNFESGWRVAQGNTVSPVTCRNGSCTPSSSGVLGIEVSVGRSILDVEYRPSSFVVGSALSMLSVLTCALMTAWRRGRRTARGCPRPLPGH